MAALAALGAAMGVWGLRGPGPAPAVDPPRVSAAGRPGASAEPESAASASPGSARPALPASLRGTEVPGGFALDSAGHFRATPDALELFDYFFSARGEEPDARIRQRIEAEIHARLMPLARAEALAFFDEYQRYREQARALFEADFEELPLEIRFQRIRELRRSVFGAAQAETLFGVEENRLRVELDRRRVAQDPDLSPDERGRRLLALEAQRPPEVRAAQAAAQAAIDLRRDEASLRAQGAGDAEIHHLREERFGADAAERLAALDRERASWQARLDEWRRTREALEREFADDPPALATAVETARNERFRAAEQIRVRGLETSEPVPGAP